MNTPTHMILSYAVLRGKIQRRTDQYWILFGGFLPDLLIYILPIYGLMTGYSMREIWDTLYFTDLWQNMIDCFNSFPILIILISLCAVVRWHAGILLGLSMCLHILGDIFLHNDDAHRHFFPFSDFRFESPVSYWDPAHHGFLGGSIELVILLVAVIYLWRKTQTTSQSASTDVTRKWRILLAIYVIFALITHIGFSIFTPFG